MNLLWSWWAYKKTDANLTPTLRMRGLKKLSTREEEYEKVERERGVRGSKYGSFEFWPGRQIGSASETQHMKRGNLGDFSICHRGSLYKWNYHPCTQPPTPLSMAFQESSICPAVCLSFQLVIPVFSYILHLYLWSLSHPQFPLSHLFSSPCVNLFLFFSLFHYHYLSFSLSLWHAILHWALLVGEWGALMSLFFRPH